MSTKEQLQERKEAQERLRKMLHPGQTVYTILRHTSKSGMTKHISVVIVKAGELQEITFLVAQAMGEKLTPKGHIKVDSTGRRFVTSLAYKLFYSETTLEHSNL